MCPSLRGRAPVGERRAVAVLTVTVSSKERDVYVTKHVQPAVRVPRGRVIIRSSFIADIMNDELV